MNGSAIHACPLFFPQLAGAWKGVSDAQAITNKFTAGPGTAPPSAVSSDVVRAQVLARENKLR